MDSPTKSIEKYKSKSSALSHMRITNRNCGYEFMELHRIGDYLSEWSTYEDSTGTINYTYAPYRIILESAIKKSINEISVNSNKQRFVV